MRHNRGFIHCLPDVEFDAEKSEMNKRKHGVEFVEAQALWLDEH